MGKDPPQESTAAAGGFDGLYRPTPTGGFGRMPRDNRVAVRGKGTGDRSFAMDYVEVGDPNRARLNVGFCEDRIPISADLDPSGAHFLVSGTRAP